MRHPTSCSSMAETMSVLFFNVMRYKLSSPKDASSDRFILSKGHAAPILYADGESAEGSIWEALHFASYYKLDNLCIIFDVNRLGQSEPTSLQHNMEVYRKRLDAFGCNAITVDGHDVEELCKAFHEASCTKTKPTAIIAKTYKGKNFPAIEDEENWHGKPLGDKSDEVIKHISNLINNAGPLQVAPQKPLKEDAPIVDITGVKLSSPPGYKPGETVATRLAYGTALAKIAANNNRVIALDGDTKNSTYSDRLKKAFPDRYIECFIAEQNLVGVAIGAACRDRTIAFVSTFATFFTRAFDQIGKAKIVKKSGSDRVLLIGAGVTLHEALSAADELAKSGIHARVLDPFTVKPIDAEAIISNAKECGLGEAVLSAVAQEKNITVKKLAVPEVPRSGPPAVLLEKYGISAKNIVKAVKELVQ
ncbi:Transketolase-like protein 1 [Blattella germanica]|nr:Transketolase-like protein 1 [Blattella germanica]